jgi:tetratricopeptide (TPR) repeat protein
MSTESPGGRATIARLMVDVAAVGLAAAGLHAPQNPIFATVAFFALCYVVGKLLFVVGPLLGRVVVRKSTPPPVEEGDGPEIAYLDDPVADLVTAAYALFRADQIDEAASRAEAALAIEPDEFLARFVLGLAQLARGRFAEGRRLQAELLAIPGLDPAQRRLLLNNIAWADYLIGDPWLRDEADRYSTEAYSGDPDQPAYQGTRGAVLVWLGRIDEGLELLRQAHVGNPKARSRALNACCIAEAEAQRGDLDTATKALEEARGLDPSCLLIDRATAAIEAAKVARAGT